MSHSSGSSRSCSEQRSGSSASASASSGAAMPILYVIGAVLALGLFVYLLFAMLQPERFS